MDSTCTSLHIGLALVVYPCLCHSLIRRLPHEASINAHYGHGSPWSSAAPHASSSSVSSSLWRGLGLGGADVGAPKQHRILVYHLPMFVLFLAVERWCKLLRG